MPGVDLDVLRRCGETRRLQIKKLRNISEEIDLANQNFNNGKIKGHVASFIGAAMGITSGVVTIATGGLALPVLGAVGAMVGVAGGLWNYMGSTKKKEKENKILEDIKGVLEQDRILQEDVRHEIEMYEILDDTERYVVWEQILVILKGWGAVSQGLGPQVASMALAGALVPIGAFFQNIPAVVTFLAATGTGLTQYFAAGSKEMGVEAIRNSVEEAGKTLPNNWTKRFIIENTYGEIMKRNGKIIAKLTEEEGEALANDVSKEIAKQAKSMSQWVGGVTLGIGAIVCVWDAYQVHEAWGPSKEGYKTKLGEALRKIATEIETSMNNNQTLADRLRGGG